MALIRAQYLEIKRLFTATIPDAEFQTFIKSSLEDQVAIVHGLILENSTVPLLAGCGEMQAKCYVLIIHMATELVTPGSKAHMELRDKLGIPITPKWPKDNPPKSVFDLVNPARTPSWIEEYNGAGAAVKLMSFETARAVADPKTLNLSDAHDAIKTAIGIGGMEDTGDPRAMPKTDLLLNLFVEVVRAAVTTVRPDWTDKTGNLYTTLPDGVDPRPLYAIEAEAEAKREAERAETKRKSEEARKEKINSAYASRKKEVFDVMTIENYPADFAFCSAFDTFRDAVTAARKAELTWLPLEYVSALAPKLPMPDSPEDKERAKEIALELTHIMEQFVMIGLNKLHPDWFVLLKNGDLKLRRAPFKEKSLGRGYSVSCKHLENLFTRYGGELVTRSYLTVYGIDKDSDLGKAILAAVPAAPKVNDEPDEEETEPEPDPEQK